MLAQNRQLQIQQLAALGETIVAALRREDQHDQIERRQRRRARQPRKGRRIERPIAERDGNAVHAHPANDDSRQDRDEDRTTQQGCDAVDGALMLRGVGAVLGVEPGDRLDRLFDMDRRIEGAASKSGTDDP